MPYPDKDAEAVRDLIADALLDGTTVIAVGLRGPDGERTVGVTATKPVALPAIPARLAHVLVEVDTGSARAVAHRSTRRGLFTSLFKRKA